MLLFIVLTSWPVVGFFLTSYQLPVRGAGKLSLKCEPSPCFIVVGVWGTGGGIPHWSQLGSWLRVRELKRFGPFFFWNARAHDFVQLAMKSSSGWMPTANDLVGLEGLYPPTPPAPPSPPVTFVTQKIKQVLKCVWEIELSSMWRWAMMPPSPLPQLSVYAELSPGTLFDPKQLESLKKRGGHDGRIQKTHTHTKSNTHKSAHNKRRTMLFRVTTAQTAVC